MLNYIYLLQRADHLETNIYKIGRTCQRNLTRFNSYSKSSQIILLTKCYDCVSLENQLIKLFNEEFTVERECGREYFEGDSKKNGRVNQ